MWTIKEVLQGSGGKGEGVSSRDVPKGRLRGFSIDSRTIRPDELFVALQGPRYDGHDFVNDALQKGGAGAIVSHAAFRRRGEAWRPLLKRHFFIRVDDPLEALQSTACWHRSRFRIPLVGVTGSNGKTTTKEMIAAILMRRGPVLKNEGNLNNQIGLPLSLLRLEEGDRAAVLEMGISQKGEMSRLCEIARPTLGLVTNIGPAHLAFLGDLEGVAREKGVLFQAVRSEGTAVINRDDPLLRPWERRLAKKWTFGLDASADLTASDLKVCAGGITFSLHVNREGGGARGVTLSTVGRHQVVNALAAAAVASALGLGLNDIGEGLERFRPPAKRGEVLNVKGIHILFDAYNANPASVKAGLEMLVSYLPGGGVKRFRKVALLGDMLELGAFAESAHLDIGRWAAETGVDRLIVVGEWAEKTAEGARQGGLPADGISIHPDLESVKMFIRKEVQAGDCLLIKGSRGMKMERLLTAFDRKGSG
ncbi:MAG: UDP-N-acetylmuramoyl-tripeptide--D-alanyl-D-alanine ligase [Nitrospiria bacterium]